MEPECVAELKDMRKSLMEDYKISPDIVSACEAEIKDHCGGGLQREGKTLHCLMDLARPKRDLISHDCKAEVDIHFICRFIALFIIVAQLSTGLKALKGNIHLCINCS